MILSQFSQSDVIIGENFNTVINPILDKSNAPNQMKTWCSAEFIKQYMLDKIAGNKKQNKHNNKNPLSFQIMSQLPSLLITMGT